MTGVAVDRVDLVNLSIPDFLGWTRSVHVPLPFPLNAGSQPYIATPTPEELDRMLAERNLADSQVLRAARSAFADPRLVVYAVRARRG